MTSARPGPVEKAAYGLAGLRLVSDLPLSGLLLAYDGGASDETVNIRLARVPEALDTPIKKLNDASFDGRQLLLNVPDVARYLIRDGKEILVEPAPSADANDIRAFLLGSAFSILCHQRGIVPLHSLAIDIPGGCVGFIGAAGAGKSTLGSVLVRRGYQIVADDVCYLRQREGEGLMVLPGIFQIRLWEDSITALGLWRSGVEREFRGYRKYLVPIPPPPGPFSPRRLLRMYRLQAAQPGIGVTITRSRGTNSLELLMRSVYRLPVAECMGRNQHAFSICASIAREIPIFEFKRAMDFANMNEEVFALERHLLDAIYGN